MTTCLKTSKKLWDAGVRLKTDLWWCNYIISYGKTTIELLDDFSEGDYTKVEKLYPSPSTDELLEVLPDKIEFCEKFWLVVEKIDNYYLVSYKNYNNENILNDTIIQNKILCEVLAELLLWLKQNYPESLEEKEC